MPRALAAPRLLRDGDVSLQPLSTSVVPLLIAASRDPEVTRWTQIPEDLTSTDAGMVSAGWSLPSDRVARFAVHLGEEPVGMLTVWLEHGAAEVGYWLLAEARGRGVATTALRLACAWVRDDCGMDRLQLTTLPGNDASETVAKHCGFTRDGAVQRDIKGTAQTLRRWTREGAPSGPAEVQREARATYARGAGPT